MSDNKIDDRQNPDQQEGAAGTTTQENVQPGADRRQVLKKILLGGGLAAGSAILPDKWAKPVVDVIIAPAHAQTSPLPTTAGPVP
jgi:hypothetical protein